MKATTKTALILSDEEEKAIMKMAEELASVEPNEFSVLTIKESNVALAAGIALMLGLAALKGNNEEFYRQKEKE